MAGVVKRNKCVRVIVCLLECKAETTTRRGLIRSERKDGQIAITRRNRQREQESRAGKEDELNGLLGGALPGHNRRHHPCVCVCERLCGSSMKATSGLKPSASQSTGRSKLWRHKEKKRTKDKKKENRLDRRTLANVHFLSG